MDLSIYLSFLLFPHTAKSISDGYDDDDDADTNVDYSLTIFIVKVLPGHNREHI